VNTHPEIKIRIAVYNLIWFYLTCKAIRRILRLSEKNEKHSNQSGINVSSLSLTLGHEKVKSCRYFFIQVYL
jgi:hypothetical protein